MQIILAAPRGFCAGVNMAIASLEAAIERFGTPVYVYHDIVHNRWVVDRFERRGVIFVSDIADVPRGAHLLYSAHGVSPDIRRQAAERELQTVDATCPLVTRVHQEAVRHAGEGYSIILIGHEGHDEVVGILGEAPGSITLIGSAEDIDRLRIANPDKLVYLTQTTLSTDDAGRIIKRLRERFPSICGPKRFDICYATQNRQQAVRELAPEADRALVVGSQTSSNSKRLAELCGACGVEAHLVDGPDDISSEWFSADDTVLITAGASVPEDVVQDCVSFLVSRFGATVELRTVKQERLTFLLPQPLREPKE